MYCFLKRETNLLPGSLLLNNSLSFLVLFHRLPKSIKLPQDDDLCIRYGIMNSEWKPIHGLDAHLIIANSRSRRQWLDFRKILINGIGELKALFNL